MLQVEKLNVGEIPLYHVQDSEIDSNCPVVIALHGLGESKDSLLPYAEQMAEHGVSVLIPDAPHHGDRSSGEDRYTLASVQRMLPILTGSLKEVGALVDYVKTTSRFHTSRIGITGVSMGGAVTLGAMARYPELRTGVALLTMGSARRFARHHNFPKLLWPAVSYLDSLLDRRRIPPRSLLMLNGAEDPIIPVNAVREFVQEMKAMYGSGGRIEMVEYPGVGHEVVPDMIDRTRDWLRTYL
ncbi:alpha/beta hydrolase family protein [Effusibacillus consociatus]|uniref:Alpha/beta hydrolase family protein n=1 Tax=Effusibacillus consociatus TaxID=1117041 RepID=A0ABV9Q5Z7_9BACL